MEGIVPLKVSTSQHMNHFDKEYGSLSRMFKIMKVVKYFAPNYGQPGTTLWNSIWDDLSPYLFAKTKSRQE